MQMGSVVVLLRGGELAVGGVYKYSGEDDDGWREWACGGVAAFRLEVGGGAGSEGTRLLLLLVLYSTIQVPVPTISPCFQATSPWVLPTGRYGPYYRY